MASKGIFSKRCVKQILDLSDYEFDEFVRNLEYLRKKNCEPFESDVFSSFAEKAATFLNYDFEFYGKKRLD